MAVAAKPQEGAATARAAFDWQDPFRLMEQLGEEERLVMAAARDSRPVLGSGDGLHHDGGAATPQPEIRALRLSSPAV